MKTLLLLLFVAVSARGAEPVLDPGRFAHHVARFNAMEPETVINHVPNRDAWEWMRDNIPLFECPDREVETTYYFRWWSFRKHIVKTPQGFVFTEFLTPVNHAGDYNTISCAAGFHVMEGRWLRDQRYVRDYVDFWLRGRGGKPQPHFHKFSSWFAAAVWDCYLVDLDRERIVSLLPALVADYRAWESERQSTNGLFWQYDVADGMEESISGSRTAKHLRPTINSYMVANARAIASVARLANDPGLAQEFDAKASQLQKHLQEQLWDEKAQFFKVRFENGEFSDAREAIGFVPWMFDAAQFSKHYRSFALFTKAQGFQAPFGITTAERAHPRFRSHGVGGCEWDGAVWPFATCQALYGLANYLTRATEDPGNFIPFAARMISAPQKGVGGSSNIPVCGADYFAAFLTYVRSQQADGRPYIGEYLDEVTGDWINRKNRSAFYNHSTFADLLITGVVGLRPQQHGKLLVRPLVPPGTWDWFCLDGVQYHGRVLSVLWDRDGSRYGRGPGMILLVDGKESARWKELGLSTDLGK